MLLQRQHFLLRYLKALSVGPAGGRTHGLPRDSPMAQPTEPPVRGNTNIVNQIRNALVKLDICNED